MEFYVLHEEIFSCLTLVKALIDFGVCKDRLLSILADNQRACALLERERDSSETFGVSGLV